MSPLSIDHRHTSPVHGVNKLLDNGHCNRGPYPEKNLHSDLLQLLTLVILHWVFFGFHPTSALLDSNPDWRQAMAWFWCCAAGESPWWLYKCGCGHCPAGTCDAGDGQNWVHCDIEGLDWYTESRDAITSTWASILKDNRSSFMTDPDGSPNHDHTLILNPPPPPPPPPKPTCCIGLSLPEMQVNIINCSLVSLHHTCTCVKFASSSPDRYSAISPRNTEPTLSEKKTLLLCW